MLRDRVMYNIGSQKIGTLDDVLIAASDERRQLEKHGYMVIVLVNALEQGLYELLEFNNITTPVAWDVDLQEYMLY